MKQKSAKKPDIHLDINKASQKELESLPSIGPKTAAAIIQHRKKHGPFLIPSAITDVNGISEKTFQKIESYIYTDLSTSGSDIGTLILKQAGSFIGSAIKKKTEHWFSNKKTADINKGSESSTEGNSKNHKPKRNIQKATGKVRKFKKYGSKVSSTKESSPSNNSYSSRVSRSEKILTEQQISKAASELGIDYASLKAVIEVESSGGGFLRNGKPKILFEGHIFWNQLQAQGISPKIHQRRNESILYPKWTKKHYKGGSAEYKRLERAIAIHKEAALMSASWGLFQVMGFNYMNSHRSIERFIEDMYESEYAHLKVFIAFIKKRKLVHHLQQKNWAAFAKGYNGSGYKKNRYDDKLAAAYNKHGGAYA